MAGTVAPPSTFSVNVDVVSEAGASCSSNAAVTAVSFEMSLAFEPGEMSVTTGPRVSGGTVRSNEASTQ